MSLRGRTLMMKVRPLFFVVFFLAVSCPVFASESTVYIQKANDLDLGNDPFWKALLHFKGGKSQILDEKFFLSSEGKVNPKAELEATIDAFFTKKYSIKRGEGGDQDVVCLFPARYLWLNEKLGLPGYTEVDACPALRDWARLDEIQDISIVYVSGYLGNPASSFGHVLLNLKISTDSEDLLGLYDTSISYGATVPASDNIVIYALKGLFGGYYAGFTDKFFYAHDQVYKNKEFRDMWEYTLNLTDHQKKIMVYHIAEVLGMRYRYFFLNANCAHRIAVFLDIFIEESVYNHDYPIYVPEELFHRLQDIDEKRKLEGRTALIKDIQYIPSARRHLFYETRHLTLDERNVYRKIVNGADENFQPLLKSVPEDSRMNVLDAVLAYQYYKLMATDDDKADKKLKEYKNKILLERLSLPAKKVEPIEIPEVVSPNKVSPPSSFNAGFVVENNNKSFSTIGTTVFRKESVGLNALNYNEMVALDLSVGYRPLESEVFINKFDFLKIRDFKTMYIEEANENPFSWQVRAGMDRFDAQNDVFYDYELGAGAGLVRKLGDFGIYYGFLNASGHTQDQHARSGPQAGFVVGNDHVKAQFDYGWDFGLDGLNLMPKYEGKIQYQINKKNGIQVVYDKSDWQDSVGVNYIYFW